MATANLSQTYTKELIALVTDQLNQSITYRLCTRFDVDMQVGKLPHLPRKLIVPNTQNVAPLRGLANDADAIVHRMEATNRSYKCGKYAHAEQYTEADTMSALWGKLKSEIIPSVTRKVEFDLDRLTHDIIQGNGADDGVHDSALTSFAPSNAWDTSSGTPLTDIKAMVRSSSADSLYATTDIRDALMTHPDFLYNNSGSLSEDDLTNRLMGRVPELKNIVFYSREAHTGSPEFAADVGDAFTSGCYVGQKANLILCLYGNVGLRTVTEGLKSTHYALVELYADVITGDASAGNYCTTAVLS